MPLLPESTLTERGGVGCTVGSLNLGDRSGALAVPIIGGIRVRAMAPHLSAVLLLAVFAGCGQGDEGLLPLPTSTPPTSTVDPSPSPSATGAWKSYQEPTAGFVVEYPPDFLVEDVTGSPPKPGAVKFLRFYDQRFQHTPAGQVVINIYAADASTASDWVAMHSGPADGPRDDSVYFRDTRELRAATIADHSGVTFDWTAVTIGAIHAVAFLYESYAVSLMWYSEDPVYESAIKTVFDRMLSSYRDQA